MPKYNKFTGLLLSKAKPLFNSSQSQSVPPPTPLSTIIDDANDEKQQKDNTTSICHTAPGSMHVWKRTNGFVQFPIVSQRKCILFRSGQIEIRKLSKRSCVRMMRPFSNYSISSRNFQMISGKMQISPMSNIQPLLDSSMRRCMTKKSYQGKYPESRRERREKERRSPFGVDGTGTKHFAELKFYHARQRGGQKETLINPFRKDIDFFDPVTGRFDNFKKFDDTKRKETKHYSDDESEIDEKLYEDYSESTDEDIYFGHGKDEDADFDDEGRLLRPRGTAESKNKKKEVVIEAPKDSLKDDDVKIPWMKTDDDIEYDDLFGKGIRTQKPDSTDIPKIKKPWERQAEEGKNEDEEEFEKEFRVGGERGDFNKGYKRNWPRREAAADTDKFRYSKGEISLHDLDDEEMGDTDDELDPKKIERSYKKIPGRVPSKSALEMTADQYLKSSDDEGEYEFTEDDYDSEWEDKRIIDNCAEDRDELGEISEMIREFDRPTESDNLEDVLDEDVQMRTDPGQVEEGEGLGVPDYESDDPHVAITDDPELLRELDEQYTRDFKRYISTRKGRKILETVRRMANVDLNYEKLLNFTAEDYENALEKTPYMKGVPVGGRKMRGFDIEKSLSAMDDFMEEEVKEARNAYKGLMEESDDEDDFEDDKQFGRDIIPDIDEQPNHQGARHSGRGQSTSLRGGSNNNGYGRRYYRAHATTMGDLRDLKLDRSSKYSGYMNEWEGVCKAQIYREQIERKRSREFRKNLDIAKRLHKYWSEFPSDEEVMKKAKEALAVSKIKNTVYCAMHRNNGLLIGVGAPRETVGGGLNIAGHYLRKKGSSSNIDIVKVDIAAYRKMRQRGEILTGAPARGTWVPQTDKDWTGREW